MIADLYHKQSNQLAKITVLKEMIVWHHGKEFEQPPNDLGKRFEDAVRNVYSSLILESPATFEFFQNESEIFLNDLESQTGFDCNQPKTPLHNE